LGNCSAGIAAQREQSGGTGQKAIELARAAGRQDMLEQLNKELKLYELGLSFRQGSK
jgi:hypothetical protein